MTDFPSPEALGRLNELAVYLDDLTGDPLPMHSWQDCAADLRWAIDRIAALERRERVLTEALEKRATLYWDNDDPEAVYDSPYELAEGVYSGQPMVVRVQRAARLPDAWLAIDWPHHGELTVTEHNTEEAALSSAPPPPAPEGEG